VTRHRADTGPMTRWVIPSVCSAVTALAVDLVRTSSGPAKVAGGVILLGALTCAMWMALQRRVVSIAPAVGLVLVSLVLIGLALAAVQALSTTNVAWTVGALTLAGAWVGSRLPEAEAPRQAGSPKPVMLLAVAGAAVFVAAATFAVHYSAASAAADSRRATSLAVWAYPAGQQLRVGARQSPGAGPISLQIVVTHAGTTAAVWSHVRLSAGQTWEAPPLKLTGTGPTRVVARDGSHVIASLSVEPGLARPVARPAAKRKHHHADRKRHEQ
jgi:hypothetical protein